MQQLVGRLTAFDPEASESLRVISYFDALVSGGAGTDALLRGAAVLSGAIAGAELNGKVSRRGPDGIRLTSDGAGFRSVVRSGAGWMVWLERDGDAHASDEMIVERLALGIDLTTARQRPDSGLEVAIDDTRTPGERAAALARLRIEPGARVRIIATAATEAVSKGAPSTIVPTRYGTLRATLDAGSGDLAFARHAGLGIWERADQAPASWDSAITALRLAEPKNPVVDAAQLGALLLVAHGYDPAHPHPDVVALDRLDGRSARILRALVESESIRSAAAELGMHHSSLQARHEALTLELGYDARTVLGRVRYSTAEFLRHLAEPVGLRGEG